MTAPTKAELREALETALAAMEYVGGFYDDRAGEPERAFMCECCDDMPVLRAFLASGLTDDERETVREAMRMATANRMVSIGETDADEPRFEWCYSRREIVAALAPIAENR